MMRPIRSPLTTAIHSIPIQYQLQRAGIACELRIALALLAVFWISCASSNPAPVAPRSQTDGQIALPPGQFDVSRAWGNLEELLAGGARPPGSEAAQRARTFLVDELARAGLNTEQVVHSAAAAGEAAEFTSVLAYSAAADRDILLFVAPYTSPIRPLGPVPGGNEGASGAAVVLELARALVRQPGRQDAAGSPTGYALYFAFVSGDGAFADPLAGSRSLAEELARRGILERVRAGFFVDRVADTDLRIARDLNSSRSYREAVWLAARKLGHADSFENDGFATPVAGHLAFQAAGVGQMVALVDPAYGGDAAPGDLGRSAGEATENCSSESLAVVGEVMLLAGREIEERLMQIDRFAQAPAAVTAASGPERRAASWHRSGPADDERPLNESATLSPLEEQAMEQAGEVDVQAAMSETPPEPEIGEVREASPAAAVAGEE